MASTLTLPKIPIFDSISRHDPQSAAVVHCLSNRTFKYGGLLPDVCRTRDQIYNAAGKTDVRGERIAFLVENSYDYVVIFLAILAARAIALPLSPPFPASELQYILSHSEASLLLHSSRYATKVTEVLTTPFPEPSPNPEPTLKSPLKILELSKLQGLGSSGALSSSYEQVTISDDDTEVEGAGMMLYTSGTTARPKGVLLPESALTAQSRALIEAWRYSPEDRLLHVLPLHHIHGTVNAILTPLFAGSTIEFLFPFNADAVWRRFANPFIQGSIAVTDSIPTQNGLTRRMDGIKDESIDISRWGSQANSLAPTTETTPIASGISTPTSQPNGPLHSGEDKYARMSKEKITFFTVVPTVYTRLLSTHKSLPTPVAEAARTAISPQHMRVSISGSAALPTPVKRAWKDLSGGNVLLERFGMTEVGMALSCGLDFADRVDGSVGWPLPGVEARLVDTETGEIIPEPVPGSDEKEWSGEIQLRGENVFSEYWANPAATAKEFVPADDGRGSWFRTGDVAVRRLGPPDSGTGSSGSWARGPMFFILGRQSADIIKSGGEKVSALEVERELLSLPEIAEAAVVAVPSGRWGQKVGAVVIMNNLPERVTETEWRPMDMRRVLRDRLAGYKIPQVLRVVRHIPRNAMGKINKRELVKQVFVDDFSGDEM